MAKPYRSTPIFDENTLPAALRDRHQTKDAVWGVIRVLEGALKLTYVEPHSEKMLTPGQPGVVAPRQTHFVTVLGPVKMQIDFHDHPPTP